MNDYEARQEAKRERYQELAQKNRDQAHQRREYADQMAGVMNGQPILIGHHSEKRHARYSSITGSDGHAITWHGSDTSTTLAGMPPKQ